MSVPNSAAPTRPRRPASPPSTAGSAEIRERVPTVRAGRFPSEASLPLAQTPARCRTSPPGRTSSRPPSAGVGRPPISRAGPCLAGPRLIGAPTVRRAARPRFLAGPCLLCAPTVRRAARPGFRAGRPFHVKRSAGAARCRRRGPKLPPAAYSSNCRRSTVSRERFDLPRAPGTTPTRRTRLQATARIRAKAARATSPGIRQLPGPRRCTTVSRETLDEPPAALRLAPPGTVSRETLGRDLRLRLVGVDAARQGAGRSTCSIASAWRRAPQWISTALIHGSSSAGS
jgi:hypothetical protein